ncbi:MAG: DUF3006 domain-containing protein [Bacillota bacterium]
MRKGIVDRFEGNIAVIEFNGVTEDILRVKLPDNCEVGDVLVFENEKITIDKAATVKKRKEINDLMNELFED